MKQSEPGRREPLVRSTALANYVEVSQAVGLDPDRMLASVGIQPQALMDPDRLIPAVKVCRLLEESAKASGVEDFGLRMSKRRSLSILGPLSLLVREEGTVRRALDAMARYVALQSQAILLHVEDSEGTVVLRVSTLLHQVDGTRQSDEMTLGVQCGYLRQLCGEHWRPKTVCIAYDPPKSLTIHEQLFGIAPTFASDFNALVCSSRELEGANPSSHPEVARYARQFLESLLAQKNQSMAEKVTRLIRILLSTRSCTVDRVAEEMAVDRRTIHRKLAAEGTSFSELLEEIRKGLAQQYLRTRSRTIAQTADLLGFSSPAAFARWFRDSFGDTAMNWRANAEAVPVSGLRSVTADEVPIEKRGR